MKSLRRFVVIMSALLFQGCVTFLGLDMVGTRRGHLMECRRILQAGDSILLEIRAWDPAEKPSETIFWGQFGREEFFSKPRANGVELKLRLGGIPTDRIAKADDPATDCLSHKLRRDYEVQISDKCLSRETTLVLGPSYAYRKPWRKFAMPLLIPLAVVADIALTPVYVGYWARCVTVGCPK